jgi:hypothetical protein
MSTMKKLVKVKQFFVLTSVPNDKVILSIQIAAASQVEFTKNYRLHEIVIVLSRYAR